nr:hypothetical protein [uncultured Tolumonas sp.]
MCNSDENIDVNKTIIIANQSLLESTYGRMCLRVHQIERTLAFILAARIGHDDSSRYEQYKKFRKLTLGKMVGLLIDKNIFDHELNEHLSGLVKNRNELIHNIGDLVADSIISQGKISELIEYIDSFIKFIDSVIIVLDHELSMSLPTIDIKMVKQSIIRYVNEWHS